MRHILLWSLFTSLGAALFAAEDSITWPAWTIPGSKLQDRGALAIIEDEDATSTRELEVDGKKQDQKVALEQRVTRRSIAKGRLEIIKTPSIKWSALPPGVYEVKVRLKFEGELGRIGTPIQLSLNRGGGMAADSMSWNACDFDDAGDYQELSMLVEIDGKTDPRLAPRSPYSTWRPHALYKRAYPDSPDRKSPSPPDSFNLTLTLPATKYSSMTGEPPNSLRSVTVDWLTIERIQPSPSITVRYAKAQKVWMRPGMTNTFSTHLKNYTDTPQQRKVRLSLTNGYSTSLVIHEEDVTLGAGMDTLVSYEWQTDDTTKLWGYELRAEVRSGNEAESWAHDYFQVHPQVYSVHVMGANTRANDPFRHAEPWANLVETFGTTSGDLAEITPPAENWVSGMGSGGRAESLPITRAMVAANLEQGIASHMYLFAGGTATALMDMMVEHPEWIASRAIATDTIYKKIQERAEIVAKHDFSTGYPKNFNIPHIEMHLNHWFPDLQKRIEDDAVSFIEKSGYMGIRWDVGLLPPRRDKTILGTKLPYDMDNAMEQAADNIKSIMARLKEVDPNFEFGANMDSWAYLEQVGLRDVVPKPPEEYPEFVALAEMGGMFMDEGTMNAPMYDHYMNRWEDCLYAMAQKRDMAGRFGGVYQLFSPHRLSRGYFAHDDIYFATFIIASGSHYVGNFAAPPYTRSSIGEFITRFSEYYWDPKNRLLEDAMDLIYVDAPADLWYADVTTYQDIGQKRRYVIPLINPPVVERLRRNKVNELPPPVDEPFDVEVTMPEGFSKATAHMITWEPEVGAHPLKVVVDDDTATVEFPGVQLFRTLVVEFDR